VLRKTIRQIADGERWGMPPTIEDPTALDEISGELAGLGYPVSHAT
jgi:propionyl-CoA synthetase